MAKLEGFPTAQKALSLHGNLVVSTWRGLTVVSRWPSRRKRPLHPKTVAQADWFQQAATLTKYLDPEFQTAARNAVKDTPLYPRDVAMMQMAGTLMAFKHDGERTLYSMATRTKVSESLDVLGDELGGVLVRHGEFWVPAVPTAAGEILVAQGSGQPPKWQAGGGGSGGFWQVIDSIPIDGSGIMDVSGMDLSSYKRIELMLEDLTTDTDQDHVDFQFYISGSLVTSGYRYSIHTESSTNSAVQYRNSSTSAIRLDGASTLFALGNAAGEYLAFKGGIDTPASSNQKAMDFRSQYVQPSGAIAQTTGVGGLFSTGEITGFKVFANAGQLQSGNLTIIGALA